MANSKAENEVSVINVVVKAVRVYSTGDNVRYRVQFDSPFQGYAKDMNGDYNLTEINYIDFVPSVLIAQCLNIVEGLDILYTKKKEAGLRSNGVTGFGAAELQAVLRNAKMQLEREHFSTGEEYVTADGEVRAHEHNGYSTSIVDIHVAERVQTKLDDMLDKMLEI